MFRIISMLMVVVLHVMGHGGVLSSLETKSAKWFVLNAEERSTNLSLVRTTLVVPSISAIISLMALITSNIKTIIDFINSLF